MEKISAYRICNETIDIKKLYILDIDLDDESKSHKYYLFVSNGKEADIKQIKSMPELLEVFQYLKLSLKELSPDDFSEILFSEYNNTFEYLINSGRISNLLNYGNLDFWNKFYKIIDKNTHVLNEKDIDLFEKFSVRIKKEEAVKNGKKHL